jgi:hypothetical protein
MVVEVARKNGEVLWEFHMVLYNWLVVTGTCMKWWIMVVNDG